MIAVFLLVVGYRTTALSAYLNDGRIEIDSNTIEPLIRGIAFNRKNALFCGPRRRRAELGNDRVVRGNLQTQLRRFARLDDRHADQTRQSLGPRMPHRLADTPGLRKVRMKRSRIGMADPLTMKPKPISTSVRRSARFSNRAPV